MEDFKRALEEITFEATDGELAATNRETPWRLKWRKILGLKCHQNLGCIASAKWNANVALKYNLVTPDLVCDRFLIALSAFPSPTISSVRQFEKVGLEINQLSSSVACDERDDVSRFFEDFDPEKHRTKLNGIRNFLWKLRNLFFSAESEQWSTIQSTSSVTNWKDSRKPFVLINRKFSRSWWESRWVKSRCISPAICKWSTSWFDSRGQLRHEPSTERQYPTTRNWIRYQGWIFVFGLLSRCPWYLRELNQAMHE